MKRASDWNYEPGIDVPFKKQDRVPPGYFLAKRQAHESQIIITPPIDPQFGQRKAFPITLPTTGVDLDIAPTSVEQYLAQVRAQSMECGVRYGSEDEDDDLVYIAPPISTPNDTEGEFDVICEEFQEKKRIYGAFRSSLVELDAIELPSTQKQWKKFIWETSCELEYIAQIIEEERTGLLLVYFTKWMSMNPDANLIAWVWAILAAFEPLGSSQLALVRSLGQKASKQLTMTPGQKDLTAICVIISLKFGQRDLLPTLSS